MKLCIVIPIALLLVMPMGIFSNPFQNNSLQLSNENILPSYILAGGQEGVWFTHTQAPQLYKVSFSGSGAKNSTKISGPASGTVWTGGWNGSDWLISGWGQSNSTNLNPYFDLYNSKMSQLSFSDYAEASIAEKEWNGGDIFSATWNGQVWLLTGMGSGVLHSRKPTNHYSMAFLSPNGTINDLSRSIPNSIDGILYASSWNGQEWLVGGGRDDINIGVLYIVSPSGSITDITKTILKNTPTFDSVQSVAWNGTDWMIGGVRFLADYNPKTGNVTDLTNEIDSALLPNDSLRNGTVNAVNSIDWVQGRWMFGGGVPVAFYGEENQTAWIASLNPTNHMFTDLSHLIPTSSFMSGILSVACNPMGCAIGGFSNDGPILIWYNWVSEMDLSSIVPGMTFVQWVGVSNIPAPPDLPFVHFGTSLWM